MWLFFFFQAEDGIRDGTVTGVQTCALPISRRRPARPGRRAARDPPPARRLVRAAGRRVTAGPGSAASAGPRTSAAGATAGPAARVGHTAIVTGANHGIGAATATALAARGCAVVCAFWRVRDPADPGTPQAYRDHRAGGAGQVVAEIEAAGSRALAAEADLSD